MFTDVDPTNMVPDDVNINYINVKHDNWQDATNDKFRCILDIINNRDTDIDNIYYFDADTNITSEFDDWFHVTGKYAIVAGEHFNNLINLTTYDTNEQSAAYISPDTSLAKSYYYGAFFGGSTAKLKEMCNVLMQWQADDNKINYEPAWNDESYINKYFHFIPHSTIMCGDFKFVVSDKGNIQDIRTSISIDDDNIELLKNNKCRIFEIIDGNIHFNN
jgi:hypothetical protein